MAILDSNSDPAGVLYQVPGNDDALRAIHTYCDLFAGAVLDGIQAEMTQSGADIGEAEAPIEVVPEEVEEELPVAAVAEVEGQPGV